METLFTIAVRLWGVAIIVLLLTAALSIAMGRREMMTYTLAIIFATLLLVNLWTGEAPDGRGCGGLCQMVVSITPNGPEIVPVADSGGPLPTPSPSVVSFLASLLGWTEQFVQEALATP